ncbi:MAG: cyclic pyranopterin monophosphate synthase MoaC [Candidatus Nitrohelix vancouverensis]|uniref:Cyclic pyranopterin monophosphate synthase n=1 Tax=Candidatus Nitrohelix vancouverensis TaxID=2705534 RepID=A0A7T0G3U2_9BACT|nr:MAG: cyclic pyranopterin monophosphate synthase MoaC [Candidatus Nitrohelix vancouverensis]
MNSNLTHFNEEGRARMVDVSEKNITERVAIAEGRVHMQPETLRLIKEGQIKKGDVLAVAQVAGIMGAKKTFEMIPMCHPLLLTNVDISFKENFEPDPQTGLSSIDVTATVKVTGKTGVEMEALTAVSVASLTIYDMCKAVDKGMKFDNIQLSHKSGGKSGDYNRSDAT